MTTKHDLAACMTRHIGKRNGINCFNLAIALGVTERKLRELITEAREEGIAICGHPSTGYYIANTREELQQTIDFLMDRAMHSLHLASNLSKIPLADLAGQLHLRT